LPRRPINRRGTRREKRILVELEQKNTELSGAYEQLAATEEELKQQYYQLADKQKNCVPAKNG
jgi:hypothetical protein